MNFKYVQICYRPCLCLLMWPTLSKCGCGVGWYSWEGCRAAPSQSAQLRVTVLLPWPGLSRPGLAEPAQLPC